MYMPHGVDTKNTKIMSRVYTAICGGYDKERTDIKVFSKYNKFKDPRLNAKMYKRLPHLLWPKEKWWLWVDGNLKLKDGALDKLIVRADDVAVFENPYRDTVGEEMEEIKRLKLDKADVIDNLPYDKSAKLPACFLIIRKNSKAVRAMNEKWWSHITTKSVRDQLSFPHCFPGARYLPRVHPFENEYFTRKGHLISRKIM